MSFITFFCLELGYMFSFVWVIGKEGEFIFSLVRLFFGIEGGVGVFWDLWYAGDGFKCNWYFFGKEEGRMDVR